MELSGEIDQLSHQNQELSRMPEDKSAAKESKRDDTELSKALAIVERRSMIAGACLTICIIMAIISGAMALRGFYWESIQMTRWEIYDNEMVVLNQYKNDSLTFELRDLNSYESKVDNLRNLYNKGHKMIHGFQQILQKAQNKVQTLEKMEQRDFDLITLYELKHQIEETRFSASKALNDPKIPSSIESIVSDGVKILDKIKEMRNTLEKYSPDLQHCGFIVCYFDWIFFSDEA